MYRFGTQHPTSFKHLNCFFSRASTHPHITDVLHVLTPVQKFSRSSFTMFYLAFLNQPIALKTDFKADGIVVFQSSTLDLKANNTTTIDNVAVNLLSGDNDFLIHVSFRRAENAIVFNSMAAGGGWGAEERVPLAGKFVGPNNTVTICDHGDRFQILIDGHTVKYYNKRIAKNAKNISYTMNPNQTSAFSNPVAVRTYDSLADVMAGNN